MDQFTTAVTVGLQPLLKLFSSVEGIIGSPESIDTQVLPCLARLCLCNESTCVLFVVVSAMLYRNDLLVMQTIIGTVAAAAIMVPLRMLNKLVVICMMVYDPCKT